MLSKTSSLLEVRREKRSEKEKEANKKRENKYKSEGLLLSKKSEVYGNFPSFGVFIQ